MDPNNQPWTPRPYEPEAPQNIPQQPAGQPQPDLTVQLHHDLQPEPWQSPQAASNPNPASMPQPPIPTAQPVAPMQSPQAYQPQPQMFEPSQSQLPQQTQWQQPIAPSVPQSTSTQPFGSTQQFGGPMAELPPLASQADLNAPTAADKKQRFIMWIIIAVVVVLPALIIGTLFLTKQLHDSSTKKAALAKPPVSYNADAIKQLAAKPTATGVSRLNKDATFYTVLKQAATQSVVQTKWDVFFTGQQNSARGDQYSLYNTTIDYSNKTYAYSEDSYSNLGLFQTRCLGAKQYNYNSSKLAASPTWQVATDSTDCAFNTVTMHLNDGFNAGGLTPVQADTFLNKLHTSGALKVDDVSLATNKGAQYLKVDADITPQNMGNGIYWGMQQLMAAFQATDLNAAKQPYTFFGSSGEGVHVAYYADLSTQLPVYATMTSSPSYDKFGKPQVTTSWSHRFIEYTFPKSVTAPTLDNHIPISFSAWPDH